MESYQFYLDTKVTTWFRTKFEVEAESLDEAKEAAIKLHKGDALSDKPWENIDDTIEVLSYEDNGNEPTEELYTGDGVLISDNIP
jgi:hypothetical protein